MSKQTADDLWTLEATYRRKPWQFPAIAEDIEDMTGMVLLTVNNLQLSASVAMGPFVPEGQLHADYLQ